MAFEQQQRNKEYARSEENVSYITLDSQQTRPLPRITTSKAFCDSYGFIIAIFIPF